MNSRSIRGGFMECSFCTVNLRTMRTHGWALLFGLAGSLMGQCRLDVTVEDATGGRIGGAVVRLADPLTNRMLSAPTSEEGLARFASAPCGAVQLAAQFGGFDEARETVRLAAGVPGQLKVVLRTTGLAERIQVTEGVDLLQTARATQSVSLGRRRSRRCRLRRGTTRI